MEVEDSSKANELLTDEELLFADDGETAEYTSGEVEQLLGGDDDEAYYTEVTGEGNEAEDESAEAGDEEHKDDEAESGGGGETQARGGRGGRRGMMMRGMMRGGRFIMGPRFFPMLPPGMRPFPPFMIPGRPPFLMRGMRPMRLPLPPMPLHMMRGMMMHRYGGPAAMRGRGSHSESKKVTTSSDNTNEKSDGPKPLMSLDLPAPVKAMAHAQHHGTGIIGMGMTNKYTGGAAASKPSSATTVTSFSRQPQKRPMHQHSAHQDHGEPAPKQPAVQRSNLTFIKTVDEPMQTSTHQHRHSQPPPSASHSYSHQQRSIHQTNYSKPQHQYPQPVQTTYRPASAGFTVAHRPAPNLTLIPLTPSGDSIPKPVPTVQGFKVMIWNLPPMTSFAEVSSMTTSCGSVRTLNVRQENNTAIIEFSNAQSADHFVRLYNNTVMNGCILTVSRI